jgi:hypothetical protein
MEECYGTSQADELSCYTYFREENHVADSLANFGLTLTDIAYWNENHFFIIDSFIKNQVGLSSSCLHLSMEFWFLSSPFMFATSLIYYILGCLAFS